MCEPTQDMRAGILPCRQKRRVKMTDRDRLIELIQKEVPRPKADALADYLLANSVTVSPVPIGSTVYEIRAKGVREYGKHRKYDYSPDTTFSLNNAISQRAILYIAPKKFCKTDKVRLNKTVFLTKEEAEEKLKELSNG